APRTERRTPHEARSTRHEAPDTANMERPVVAVLCSFPSVVVVLDHLAIGDGLINLFLAVMPPAGVEVGLAGAVRVDGKERQRPLEVLSLARREGRHGV